LASSGPVTRGLEIPIDVGHGPPLVLLHGFGMRPATYRDLVDLLAPRCRVVVPDLFALRGPWTYNRVLDAFTDSLDALGLDRASLLGHSFGGGIALAFASRHTERVVELVFSDTLAASREWRLATEVLSHPLGLLRLATPMATSAFVRTWIDHPRQLADAAWWGFTSKRESQCDTVAAAHIPSHVLWANRDSILSRADGRRFAQDIGATFTVACPPDGQVIDHDWMFQQPELFLAHLETLGLIVMSPPDVGGSVSSPIRGRRPPVRAEP
jgi:pimeloyl-ACP methyl ester carboxylesterase